MRAGPRHNEVRLGKPEQLAVVEIDGELERKEWSERVNVDQDRVQLAQARRFDDPVEGPSTRSHYLINEVIYGSETIRHRITARTAHYEHPLRRRLWRAGHAHAGVLLILSLVDLTLVDRANLGDGGTQVVRTSFPLAALLLPIAYFLSIARPDADRRNRLVNLAYLGAVALTLGMLTLGIGLLRAT